MQELIIEVTGQVVTRQGADYTSYSQECYAHMPDQKYPVQIRLNLESANHQYPIGKYTLDVLGSLYVSNGVLTLSRRLKLTPVAQKAVSNG